MGQEKIKNITYWATTILTAASYAFGGFVYISRGPDVVDDMSQLGYPLYFAVILGVWKLLGALAIIVPRFPLVKEWAYAGMVINLTSAAISNAIAGNKTGDIVAPLTTLLFVFASWRLRPPSRTLTASRVV